jgi:hypothetical protein
MCDNCNCDILTLYILILVIALICMFGADFYFDVFVYDESVLPEFTYSFMMKVFYQNYLLI